MNIHRTLTAALMLLCPFVALAGEVVLDIPTRPGVTQRLLLAEPAAPRAVAVLFAGGHGGLRIFPGGSFRWGEGNFLVRSRGLFVQRDIAVALIDTPSDRQMPPYLDGFRNTSAHVADIAAVIAALRKRFNVPVWLVGTSRGTQSVAFAAAELSGASAPDGMVLTSPILKDDATAPVPALALHKVRVPTLVIHHENDQCANCLAADLPALEAALQHAPRFERVTFNGGTSKGNPCGGYAFHGFNGIEDEVVARMAAWITAR